MGGSSKGGGGHTPHEAPDSLRSAQKLRAIGLISLGPIKGPTNKWKDTYFDNTPIQNANGVDDNDAGSFNFKNTEIQYNLGYQDQKPLDGFEASEREVSVGAEVKQQHPITRSVIDPDVTRLRLTIGVNALISQNEQGDTNGTSVDFQILVNNTPRGTYQIEGKSSSRFYRSYIIDDLPPRPFTVTVKRFTADSKSQRLQNGTHWVSYTEIIDTKLSYPNMAIVGIKTDSRYNPNFPNINFLLYGRIIKIPTTYDPEARTYAPGIWKGDWKLGWTNNPAWIFYDLITNKLAGLGQRIGDYGIDKFQLYEIAKYCDELVDDGYGGKEPRMVSNLWITEQREAYNVLSDMASVFRSIAVWDGTQFTAIQDRPADPVCLYSQSNVKDGKFTRQYAAGKAIFTAVEVEYADERNMYQKAIEYVADDSMIARYGYNVKKMTAYGCTSRGQAHRYGKWVLETSRLEQCTITFSVGRQGLMHLPGDIIEVADNSYAGKVLGGRVVAISGKKVTLDQPVEIKGESYLNYITADGLVKIKIKSVDKANPAIIDLDSVPQGLSVFDNWVLKSGVVSTQLYRALGITENDDGSYTITALQHEPQKEAIVDGSASFVPSVTTAHGAGVNKPANADVSFGDGGVKLTWTTSTNHGAVKYDVKLYRNGNLYSTHLDLDSPEISFDNLPNGRYTVEIRSKNRAGQLSDPITRTFEINLNIPRFVTKSLLFAIELDWDLPKTATVGNYTEVWRSTTNDISKAVKVATLPYPQNNYVMSGVPLSSEYYFWLRCGDKNDNKGEFTAAVFGEADHNPDNLLNAIEGKITKSHLGQSLIESLKADIDEAVDEEGKLRQSAVANAVSQILAETQARAKAIQDESNARIAAINAEASNRTKAIQAEATARGTAVTQLQQTDAQQAQLITGLTAKAEQAIAGLQEEKTARAEADKSEAQARNALTSRVASAESGIAAVRKSIATANNSIAEVSQNLNAKIDGIKVGGRNYLEDTELFNRKMWEFSTGSAADRNHTIENGVVRIVGSSTTWKQFQLNAKMGTFAERKDRSIALAKLEVGQTYTLSFEARVVEGNPNIWTRLRADSATGNRDNFGNDFALTSEWQRYSYTRTIKEPIDLNSWRVIFGYSKIGVYEFRKPKLELGTLATDWTPAPEDLDQSELINAKFVDIRQVITSETEARTVWQNNAISRINGVESNIANIQRSVTSATQSISEVSQNLNAKIDNIKIGGRNYLLDSSFKNGKWYKSQGRGSKATIDVDNGVLTISSDNATWKQYQINGYAHKGGLNELVDGAKVTISFEVMTPDDNTNGVIKYWMNLRADRIDNTHGGSTNPIVINQTAAPSKWSRVSVTGIAIQPTNFRGWRFILGVSTPGTVKFRNPKLEVGNVATDWTPAPEDLDGAIGDLSADLNHYKSSQATKDQATSMQLTTLTARMANAESGISMVEKAVSDAKSSTATQLNQLSAAFSKAKTDLDAKIEEEKTARANADRAEAEKTATMTSRVANAESKISQVSKTVADVSGKLSATHTIKTQVIGGGRTAIAGIVLGASSDGKTAESSVIVMADKFGIVANANDSNVKQVFSVANGQVGIRGDLVVAGSVTRDKLSSGGGNLLDNPIFANNAYGWGENRGNGALTGQTTSLVRRMSNKFSGLVTNSSVMIAEVRANSAVSSWWQIATQTVSVDPGRRYCFSAYMDAWACTGELMIQEIAGDGKSWVRDFAFSGRKGRSVAGYSQSGALEEGDGSIQSSTRSHVFFTAPSTGYISVVCIMRNIQKASVLKVAMPMLEECTDHATEPSPWQNAGVTEMHGGSIIANTIRGDHIQANQEIRSPRISGGEIDISGNDGILRVGRTGNFLVRASSQNRGLVMNNDQIIVYDERGNVRVKIGRL